MALAVRGGAIAGGPTLVGSIVGFHVTSEPLELAFYALAGGALLYVIGEIWNGVRKLGHRELAMWFLFGGIIARVADRADRGRRRRLRRRAALRRPLSRRRVNS